MQKLSSNHRALHLTALIILFLGAVGSLALMFKAGSEQKSIFLILLFTIWVLSPFVGLVVANQISKQWPISTRVKLYWLMMFISAASLVGYSGVFNLRGTKTAFKFLIVPLISWGLIFVIIPLASTLLKRIFRKTKNLE